ncbi:DUF262 domain-containing protein [Bacillus thuringiensis]|uniref:DUF262 domain-containing protein n=1 Tax=Bacillus thuringiensis TaxID=1428 RepID=UPI0011A059E5|nr:DUF262 domain-containing protein [Bacillus thuringiensis]
MTQEKKITFNKKSNFDSERLLKRYKTRRLNFDLAIQRKENIWDKKRQSLLIHSILSDYYIPPIVAIKDNDSLSVLDGKQRLTSLFSFMQGDLILDKTTPNVNGEKIAGLNFEDLSEEFQSIIKKYKFDFSISENLNEQQIEELFFRLNNGVALRTIEVTRALLGNSIISFLKRITDFPFFEYKINITASARKRYTDQEIVLQILKLIYEPNSGLNKREMQPFIDKLKNEDLKAQLKSTLDNAIFYLNEAFPKKQKFLKKVNIPMLVILVLDVIKSNQNNKVTPIKFGEWAEEFFENTPEEYRVACQSGSASAQNVKKRLSSMRNHFCNYFKLSLEDLNLQDESESATSKNEENLKIAK